MHFKIDRRASPLSRTTYFVTEVIGYSNKELPCLRDVVAVVVDVGAMTVIVGSAIQSGREFSVPCTAILYWSETYYSQVHCCRTCDQMRGAGQGFTKPTPLEQCQKVWRSLRFSNISSAIPMNAPLMGLIDKIASDTVTVKCITFVRLSFL